MKRLDPERAPGRAVCVPDRDHRDKSGDDGYNAAIRSGLL